MLGLAAAIAGNPQMADVISNPAVSNERLTKLFLDICGDRLDAQGQNLAKVLIENDRLVVLPEIAALYEELRAEAEKTIDAEMISAYEVSEDHKQKIVEALRARLQREVTLTCRVDENLIGGAVIRAGDLVIDGSAKAQLNKLAVALSS
jgi:F-type H+-transporting ATPase subunit delta